MLTLVLLCACATLAISGVVPPPTRFDWRSEDCGVSQYEDAGAEQGARRIVGGWEARPHEFPWQVSILWRGSHVCGGWIVSKNHVITAAHCTEGYPIGEFATVVGEHLRDQDNDYKQTIEWADYDEHPNWNDVTFEGDICVVTLAANLTFSEAVQPVCAPARAGEDDYAGEAGTVAGWGTTRSPGGGPLPNELLYTNLPIIEQQTCRDFPILGDDVKDDMICATTGPNEDRDTCQGDSGGVMTVKRESGQFEAVGIVSWGYDCAGPVPGVYTRVPYYVEWVDSIIQ